MEIKLTQEQIEAFNRGESIIIKKEPDSPKYFKYKNKDFENSFIVKFISNNAGTVVQSDNSLWSIGTYSDKFTPNYNNSVWEEIKDFKYDYPIYCRLKSNNYLIVKFDSIMSGYIVEGTGMYSKGAYSKTWPSHENFNQWQHLPNYKEQTQWGPEEEAEYAATQMRIHNRLLAYVAEFDKDWKADWGDDKQKKYFVYSDSNGLYHKNWSSSYRYIGVIYMSEKCAEGLCEKLNSGEVVL